MIKLKNFWVSQERNWVMDLKMYDLLIVCFLNFPRNWTVGTFHSIAQFLCNQIFFKSSVWFNI